MTSKKIVIYTNNPPSSSDNSIINYVRTLGHTPIQMDSVTSTSIQTIGTSQEVPLILVPSDKVITSLDFFILNSLGYVFCLTPSTCKTVGFNYKYYAYNYVLDRVNSIQNDLFKTFNTFYQVLYYYKNTAYFYKLEDVPITPILAIETSSILTGVFPKGSTSFQGVTKTPVVFCILLGANTDHESSKILISDIISYAIETAAPPFKVEGQVTDVLNNPLQRQLRAHLESSGKMLSNVTSNVDGFYKLTMPTNQSVYVVCLPSDTNKKAQVINNIIPESNE